MLTHRTSALSQFPCKSFAICSRASTKMRVLPDHRDEGSLLHLNPCRICSYKMMGGYGDAFCEPKRFSAAIGVPFTRSFLALFAVTASRC